MTTLPVNKNGKGKLGTNGHKPVDATTSGRPSLKETVFHEGQGHQPEMEIYKMPKDIAEWGLRADWTEEKVSAAVGILRKLQSLKGYTDWGQVIYTDAVLSGSIGGKRTEQFIHVLTHIPRAMAGFGERFLGMQHGNSDGIRR